MPEIMIETVPAKRATDKAPRRPKTEPGAPNEKKQTSKTLTLEKELNELSTWVSWLAAIFNKTDGEICAAGIPPITHEFCMLAESDPKLLKILKFIASPGKYGPLSIAILGLITPLAINHNLIPMFALPTENKEAA